MKDTFTKREVVEMLVKTYNRFLKEIGDHDKYFVIEGDLIFCKRKRMFGMSHKILNQYTFDDAIQEAQP